MSKQSLSIIFLSALLSGCCNNCSKHSNSTADHSATKSVTQKTPIGINQASPNQIKRISGNRSKMTIPTSLHIETVKAAPENAPLVKTGQTVTVNYTGWLYDNTKADKRGAQFDSSKKPGRQPFKFRVGAGMVIEGWDKGLQKMQIGGTYLLTIPSDLGYGTRGAGGAIPANAPLLFEIEVLAAS